MTWVWLTPVSFTQLTEVSRPALIQGLGNWLIARDMDTGRRPLWPLLRAVMMYFLPAFFLRFFSYDPVQYNLYPTFLILA